MAAPLVSVIIPCYRQAHYLAAAVDSVLAQTYRHLQVIVVNDGSDDDTEGVARTYGDRVVYLYKENGGLASARNAGIRIAEGEYLNFLDSDDLLHAEAIQRLVDAVDGRPNRLGIIGHQRFLEDPLLDAEEAVLPPATSLLIPLLLRMNFPVHCYLCSRQRVADAGGFEARFNPHEDWDLWLRLALGGAEPATVQAVGALYRRSPGSMSSNSLRMLASAIKVVLRVYEHITGNAELLRQWGPELSRLLYATRRRCRLHGYRSTEADQLSEGIQHLRDLGIHVREPLLVQVQDRLPSRCGDVVEQFGLLTFRVLRPRFYASLKG